MTLAGAGQVSSHIVGVMHDPAAALMGLEPLEPVYVPDAPGTHDVGSQLVGVGIPLQRLPMVTSPQLPPPEDEELELEELELPEEEELELEELELLPELLDEEEDDDDDEDDDDELATMPVPPMSNSSE
jgi:hypothetical protein